MVMMAVPGLPAAALLRFSSPPVERWPASPPEGAVAAVTPPARWDEPARASLALLRRVTATESRRASSALVACEARAAHGSAAHRNLRFRRCAVRPLARTDGFA